jgi:cell division protein FtsW
VSAIERDIPRATPAPEAEWTTVTVRRGPIDVPLLAVALGLTSLGIVMIYSASSVVAHFRYDDHAYFLSRQLVGVAVGLVALALGMRIDYRWYRRLAYPILAVAAGLLALIFVPGVGVAAGGARRWLQVGGFSFQPSELVKVAAVIYLAYSVSKKHEKMRYFTLAFIPHLLVIGGLVALLLPQPDFGSSAILMAMLGMMLFLGGARVSYLLGLAIAAGVVAYDAVMGSEYRMNRIQAYLNPDAFRQGSGWQLSESLIALGSGGIEGLGLGAGYLKLGFVPELWNDFIGTIIGHELGLLGIGGVVVLFLVFLWRGVRIAQKASDSFGSCLAFGLTVLIVLQAATHLGVATGLLPTKGLTLPFVSFGRSSIIVSLFAVGVLSNIAQRNDDLWQEAVERREQERYQQELDQRRARLAANRKALANQAVR